MKKTAQIVDPSKWPDNFHEYQKAHNDKLVWLARKAVIDDRKNRGKWGLATSSGKFLSSDDDVDDEEKLKSVIIRAGEAAKRARRASCHELAESILNRLRKNKINARRIFVDKDRYNGVAMGHSTVFFQGDDGHWHRAANGLGARKKSRLGDFDSLEDAIDQYIAVEKANKQTTDEERVDAYDTTDLPFTDKMPWPDYKALARTGKRIYHQEKKAVARDFSGLLKLANIEKSAKNITRLLARIGDDLAGATDRDLKYLSRRGFKGFNPKQVKSLRARGFLPSIEQEFAGFNKGTENMLHWVPKKTGRADIDDAVRTSTMPVKEITRTNSPGTPYQSDISLRRVVIPDTNAPGSIKSRERRSAIARHEAREWVRGNKRLSRGEFTPLPGHSGGLGDWFTLPEVGSSHAPGVIHDERVFRSQLANRLGLNKKWDELPLGWQKGKKLVRGTRDSYVGMKPLPYEFEMINQWKDLRDSQMRDIRNAGVGLHISRHYEDVPGLDSTVDKITDALFKKYKASRNKKDLAEYGRARSIRHSYYEQGRYNDLEDSLEELKDTGRWGFNRLTGDELKQKITDVERELSKKRSSLGAPVSKEEYSNALDVGNRLGYVGLNKRMLKQELLAGRLPDFVRENGAPEEIYRLVEKYQDAVKRIGLNNASRLTGIPKDEIVRILSNEHVFARRGSELNKIMTLNPMPRRI